MEWYYKNRWGCNISKKRLKVYFTKILFSLLSVFVISFFCIYLIDLKINSIVMPYIDVEVERLVNNIVKSAVNEEMKNINLKEILILDYDCISYDAIKIN